MDGSHQIFPSVAALTIEADDESIYLRQLDEGSERVDVIDIPRMFLPAVIRCLVDSVEPGRLKDALTRALDPEAD